MLLVSYKEKLALVSQCSPELAYNLRILPANEKQEMVADEIFHTALANKKQGKLTDTANDRLS